MTCRINKIQNAGQAFAYYSDKDDYYLSDKSSAEWYGAGAAAIGLRGEIDPRTFRDVLLGRIGAVQVGREGTRKVEIENGTTREIPNHMPGWDVTFSAPKSVSIVALVQKDERLTAAHDAAVRAAMDHLQRNVIATRQRTAAGGYDTRLTGNLIAGIVRHSTSRNLDPQLHSHAILANVTRDPVSGELVSIDSRAGLFGAQIEANNIYMNELARLAREAGYKVEWTIRDNNAVSFELVGVTDAELDLFSTRTAEIEAALEAKGLNTDQAHPKQIRNIAHDTRSPKQHVPGQKLHADWVAKSAALGLAGIERPVEPPPTALENKQSARAALQSAMDQISERQTRFTQRELVGEAITYLQGRASHGDLAEAYRQAVAEGDLIHRKTQIRGLNGELTHADGVTTNKGVEIEIAMLHSAAAIVRGKSSDRLTSQEVDVLIAKREEATGFNFSDEQRAATCAVLSGDSGLTIIQGFAGTAKTTTVLATVAAATRERGMVVRAMAPTHSAADTLAKAIGAESATVASVIVKGVRGDGRRERWIVDEAGMVSAGDMRKLLEAAVRSHAEVILVGDRKQIGSVGAGSAFGQLQSEFSNCTYSLTDIKRQRNEQLREAVYDLIHGRPNVALGKVAVHEIPDRGDAIDAIADAYREHVAAGEKTLVIALSRVDRDEINAAIQKQRELAGEVQDVQAVTVLRAKDWTDAEARDASRYRVGDTIAANRKFKSGPGKDELVTVTRVYQGVVTTVRADGQEWSFDPTKVRKITALDRSEVRIGVGDRLVAKGNITVRDQEGGEPITVRNGTAMTVTGLVDGSMSVITDKGAKFDIAAKAGVRLELGLGYAQTADQAQGQTTQTVLEYTRSTQVNLADMPHTYVPVSRAVETVEIFTDNKEKLIETLERSRGPKETALDIEVATARMADGDIQAQAVKEREAKGPVLDQRNTDSVRVPELNDPVPPKGTLRELGESVRDRLQPASAVERAGARHIREATEYREADLKFIGRGSQQLSRGIDRNARQSARAIKLHATRQLAVGGFISGLKTMRERDKRLAQTEIRRKSAQIALEGRRDSVVEREARRRVRRSGMPMDTARVEVQDEARRARRSIAVRGAVALGNVVGGFANPGHDRVRKAAKLERAALQASKTDTKLVLGGGAEKEIAEADRKLRRIERDVRRAFGTNPNLGAFGQALEGKLAKEGRRHFERFQAAHDREVAKVHALREAAIGRMAAALVQKEGITKAQATERIEKESLARRLERQQPIVSALARVANSLAARESTPRAVGFKESTIRDRFVKGEASQISAVSPHLTPQDLARHQLVEAASKESARWRGNEHKLDPAKHRTENHFLDNVYNDPKFSGHFDGSDKKATKQKHDKKVKSERKAEQRHDKKKAQRIETLLNLDSLKPHRVPKPTQEQALQDKIKPLTPEKPEGEKSSKQDGGIEMM
jgi:conjugative relaxase-like TrwC/TraI family protein